MKLKYSLFLFWLAFSFCEKWQSVWLWVNGWYSSMAKI